MLQARRDNPWSDFSVLDLGLVDYDEAYSKQKELVEKKRRDNDRVDYLMLVEHPEIYTYGRRSPVQPDVSVGENFRYVERGGEVTYHNPGQLVAYPILNLREGERDLHLHLRRLEQTIINVLQKFSLKSSIKDKATGVWVDQNQRKVASIGVAVTSWVTYHGVALNVCNNLAGFGKINPCGFASQVMTSMERETGKAIEVEKVKLEFIPQFAQNFRRNLN
jgi:lipoyl(octanoyl) transferase